jgi:hypothetical protein
MDRRGGGYTGWSKKWRDTDGVQL